MNTKHDLDVQRALPDCHQVAPDLGEAPVAVELDARGIVQLAWTIQRNLILGHAQITEPLCRSEVEEIAIGGHPCRVFAQAGGTGYALGMPGDLLDDVQRDQRFSSEPIDGKAL